MQADFTGVGSSLIHALFKVKMGHHTRKEGKEKIP
jgi:hypothetical protein